MPTMKVRSVARTPDYDGTETSSWAEVTKTFAAYRDAFYENTSAERPEDVPTTVGEAPSRMHSWIAKKTLLGDATDPQSVRDLLFFPVVNPDTLNLSAGALRSVLSGRGAQADIPENALTSTRRVAERLLDDEFDEEDAQSTDQLVTRVCELADEPKSAAQTSLNDAPTIDTSQPMTETEPQQERADAPYETLKTPEGFDDVKEVRLTPDDEHVAGVVKGYGAAFLNLDADQERFDPEAFTESIREMGPDADQQRIRHLHAHKASEWLGQPGVLEADDHGLLFETRVLDTRLGRDVMKGYQEDIFEHSVGFIRRGEEQLDDGSTLITKAKLFEISTVPWGANPMTPTVDVQKSFTSASAALAEVQEKLDSMRSLLRRGLSEITEHDVEVAARQLETLVKALSDPDTPTEKRLTITIEGGDRKAGMDLGTDTEQQKDLTLDVSFFEEVQEKAEEAPSDDLSISFFGNDA